MSITLAKLLDRYGKPLYVVIAVAVIIRVLYFTCYLDSPLAGYYRADQQYYRSWAMDIADGDWIGEDGFEQGPLYPYLLAGVYNIFGMHDNVALVLQMTLGVVTCVLVYLCGRQLFDEQTAFIAGVATAMYGPLVFYECMIMKSFLSPLLTMTTLYCALRYVDHFNWAWLIGAGAAIGLVCQIRENHVLLIIPVIMWVVYHARKSPSDEKEEPTEAAQPSLRLTLGVLIGALVLVMLPATIRNYAVAKEIIVVTSGGGEVFYLGNGPHATGYFSAPPFVKASPYQEHEDFREEARRQTEQDLTRAQSSRYWFRQGMVSALTNPVRTVWLTVVKASILLNDFEVPDSQYYAATRDFLQFLYLLPSFGCIVGLGVFGIAVCWKNFGRYQLPILFVAAHVISVLLFYNFGRFRVGMVPVLILFAVHGCLWIIAAIKNAPEYGSGKAVTAALVVVVVTVLAFVRPLNYSLMTYEIDRENLKSRLAMRQQKLALAQRHFTNALSLCTTEYTQAVAHRNLGDVMHQRGNVDDAIAQYSKSLELDSESAETLQRLGDLLHRRGDSDGALDRYYAARDLDPKYIPAYIGLAAVLLERGDFKAAERSLNSAMEVQPDQAQLHSLLGAVLIRQMKLEEGLEHHRRAVRIDSNSAETFHRYALDLELIGRQDERAQRRMLEAVENYEAAIRRDKSFAPAREKLAMLLIDLAERLEKPINTPPFRVPTQEGMKYLARAVEQFEAVVEHNPKSYSGHLGLGFVYPRMSRYLAQFKKLAEASQTLQKAPPHFIEARNLRPNDPRSYLRYAEMLSEVGTPEQETEQLEMALQLPREHTGPTILLQVHQRLAQIYAGLDNHRVVVKHFREMLLINKDLDRVQNDLAWILATSDDDELRDGVIARINASNANDRFQSKNPIYLDTLAAAEAEMGYLNQQETESLEAAAKQAEADGNQDEAKSKRDDATAAVKAADKFFAEAVRRAKESIEILDKTPEAVELLKSVKKRLELYEKRQPYHGKIR